MGLKKRNKVSAEFSMSSLTDIIFLLLIFFMLTSNFVRIENFDLPESNAKTVAPTTAVVTINKAGQYTFNQKPVRASQIEQKLRSELRKMDKKEKEEAALTIVAEKGVPFKKVQNLMEIAGRLRIRAIIATKPKPEQQG